MTAVEEEQVLLEFGTGFQHTRISAIPGGGVSWRRTPGPQRPAPFPVLSASYATALRDASDERVRFARPVVAEPDAYLWEVNGRHSFGALLEASAAPAEAGVEPGHERLPEYARVLGLVLRALHSGPGPSPAEELPQPPGPRRLAQWLAAGRGPRASAGFHYRLRSRLGTARWRQLADLTYLLLTPGPQEARVTLHGGFSLGAVVVADPAGTGSEASAGSGPEVSVLSGPEAAAGRPEADVAWALGELTEYRAAAQQAGIEWPLLDEVRESFLTAYGQGLDTRLLRAGETVRVACHAADFACYVGWAPQLHGYSDLLVGLLDGIE
ncbi:MULTISPECIES: hypothetical protein [unclassified Kitasatospora]|uniref:hypothetical protein n=1 Tax=unclassified Kitasatospora TaxID=2633591 RepID=UPI003405953F